MTDTDLDLGQSAVAGADADGGVGAGAERFMAHLSGYLVFTLLAVGHRVGLLDAVRSTSGTVDEIAAVAGTHERPTREWLATMTAAGYLRHDAGVFSLAEGQSALFDGQVLPFDPTVLFMLQQMGERLGPELERALRDGRGIPYATYQPEFSAAQDAMNAPLYEQFLVAEWIPSVDGLHERLTDGADVADVGCGGGRALCLLAAAYPRSRFVGIDVDDTALEIGRERAAASHLTNVRFERRDAARLGEHAAYDVVIAVDAIHDQADPTAVVGAIRHALRPDGVFVMVEPTASGDLDVDAANPASTMGYATSLMHCVQVSLAEGGPGLGAMWGRRGAQAIFGETGFGDVSWHESPSDYTIYAARS